MLAAQGIITKNDAKNIARGLDTICQIGNGSFDFKRALEDIHECREQARRVIGPARGGCTPRVRATIRWQPISGSMSRHHRRDRRGAASFQRALVERALEHAGTVMPASRSADRATVSSGIISWPMSRWRRANRGRFADARKASE